jgi:hypothetical protein
MPERTGWVETRPVAQTSFISRYESERHQSVLIAKCRTDLSEIVEKN